MASIKCNTETDKRFPAFAKLLRDTLPPRCGTCAFTAGTQANLQPGTRVKAELCVNSGEAFLCHEADRRDEDGQVACIGWAQAVIKKAESGWYQDLPPWKKELNERMADLITAHEDAILAGREYDHEAEMSKALAEMDAKYGKAGSR